ncbi:hypothetical protein ANCDUO_24165 [Ancylostoma duodenale]|uniref:Sodium bile acid symporter family protein n=1 Tax=Ancylostoma duodenale TaxID=51022 RepID=A0A0C2FGE9_9BILA|nr:hypothetical protein ANCDUO_24165 [Ancylostoma duodenale]
MEPFPSPRNDFKGEKVKGEKTDLVMRPFIIFVLIFVIVFGAISNWYMFRMMTVPALLGGLLLPWCGFMFGCFASILTRRAPADVTAIAIETGIQNTGIAILVLKDQMCEDGWTCTEQVVTSGQD